MPLVRWGKAGIEFLQQIDDYSCTLVTRERLRGRVGGHRWMSVKVRHRPFSVYARFLAREGPPRQEIIYIDGANDGKMWVHSDDHRFMGTMSLFPDCRRAMRESRYPISEVGVLTLIERLVAYAEEDIERGDCELQIFSGSKIQKRPCLCVAITHPTQGEKARFHHARIYIDEELNLPVRYESYWWPKQPGGRPQLIEQYTYLDIQLNRGFTERDFDVRSAEYYFPPEIAAPTVLLASSAPQSDPPNRVQQVYKPTPGEHPLTPALHWLKTSREELSATDDYTCTLTQRQWRDGDLGEHQHAIVKFRRDPRGIYLVQLGPQQKGAEAIYVPQQYRGQVMAHGPDQQGSPVPAVAIDPTNPFSSAMGNRPMTTVGIEPLLTSLIKRFEAESKYGECRVDFLSGAQVDQRGCTCLQIVHPVPRKSFRYHVQRIFIDDELNLPIRFEGYTWPRRGETSPVLVEELTYRSLEQNVGLTDVDFDTQNPDYLFEKASDTEGRATVQISPATAD